jgi:hypothetical protein
MAATASRTLPAARLLSPATLGAHPRILIFSASLLLKGAAGAVFFGSVDLVNAAQASLALLQGKQIHVPYFPVINAFLWFGGVLSAILPVPLTLSLKLVPILFDSLLAVLVYDLVRRHRPRLALRAGLLYALSPVALLITSFQGQWDAIALFFLLLALGVLEDGVRDPRKQILFGALFGISLLIKPIALPFLLLFPSRSRPRWLPDWPAILGLTFALGIAFAAFVSFGYSIAGNAIEILAYSAKGVQTFGLPFAPLLDHLHIQSLRLWVVLPMIFLADRHHKCKLTSMDAMLLFYLCCVATTGLSPQYLLWPLPLLLVTQRLRLAGFYSAVATAFLLLYYSNPWTSYYAFENLGVFAPLRNLSWLLPPSALEERELLPVVHLLGNLAFPACAIWVGALVVKSSRRPMAEARNGNKESGWPLSAAEWYAAPFFLISAAILAAKLIVHTGQVPTRLARIWSALPSEYGLRIPSLKPSVVVLREAAGLAPLNVIVLLALFTAAWCAFCVANSDDSSQRPGGNYRRALSSDL